jgi:hypothetical protein
LIFQELRTMLRDEVSLLLVGTKNDLPSVVSEEEIAQCVSPLPSSLFVCPMQWRFDWLPVHRLCKVVNAEHVTTSARLDVGVEEAFLKLAESA